MANWIVNFLVPAPRYVPVPRVPPNGLQVPVMKFYDSNNGVAPRIPAELPVGFKKRRVLDALLAHGRAVQGAQKLRRDLRNPPAPTWHPVFTRGQPIFCSISDLNKWKSFETDTRRLLWATDDPMCPLCPLEIYARQQVPFCPAFGEGRFVPLVPNERNFGTRAMDLPQYM